MVAMYEKPLLHS